jgi:hypothetical protein
MVLVLAKSSQSVNNLPIQHLALLLDFGLELLKVPLLLCYRLLNQFEIPHCKKLIRKGRGQI